MSITLVTLVFIPSSAVIMRARAFKAWLEPVTPPLRNARRDTSFPATASLRARQMIGNLPGHVQREGADRRPLGKGARPDADHLVTGQPGAQRVRRVGLDADLPNERGVNIVLTWAFTSRTCV